jgi:hypothetical protein
MDSQCTQILRALKRGQHITPLKALERFGCFRLGARIHDLREQGWDIQKRWVESRGKRFASYYLVR